MADELDDFAQVWTLLGVPHKLLEIEQQAKDLREALETLYVGSRVRVWAQELRPPIMPEPNRGSHQS